MRSFGNKKSLPEDILPSGGVKTRFHSDFSLVQCGNGHFPQGV